MLKFQKVIERNEIPSELWGGFLSPEDVKDVKPIAAEIKILHLPQWGGNREITLSGHLGSSAHFDGMGWHGEPVHKEFANVDGVTVFYNYNNNNGQEIVFIPKQKVVFEHMQVLPISPCYSTWQPNKVILLSFDNESDKNKRMTHYKETLDLVENFWKNKLEHLSDLGVYLATAGYFKQNNYFSYIHSANFLRELGFPIPKFNIPNFAYQSWS